MSEDKKASLDLGAMLDSSLDNITEAPDFINPPSGDYRLRCKEVKIDKYKSKDEPNVEKQRLKIYFETVSTLKLADEKEPPVPDGSIFTETFMATEEGLGYFKKRGREIMNVENVDGVALRDIMASIAGQEFNGRISYRTTPNKNKPGEVYTNLQLRVIPATE